MCSLTNGMQVYRPKDPSCAVFHHSDEGPNFNNALVVGGKMNLENNGRSVLKGHMYDVARYCVLADM